LEKYAGKYQNEMYGEATLAIENGKLVLRFGPNFIGDLEHWNYDTFRVVWRDATEGKTFVNFRLNTQAKVDWMNVNGITEFSRAPDTPPAAASTGNQ
jgi:hypothetical protein